MWDWRNKKTGKVVDHSHWSTPPDNSGDWERVFKFGVGRVEGAGGSPARSSVKKEKKSAR